MSKDKGGNAARITVSAILSFVLCLTLFLATLLIIIRTGVFSLKGFEKVLNDDYIRSALNDFNAAASDYTIPTNIDVSVLDGAFTYEDAKQDILGFVREAFSGRDYDPELTGARQRLAANVDGFFASNDVESEGEIKEIRDEYVNDICRIYKKNMKMPGLELIIKAKSKFSLITVVGVIVSLIVSFVLGFFAVKVHTKAYRGLRFIAYATGAVSLMCFVGPAILYFSGSYRLLSLTPEYFYRFVVGLISRMIGICFTAAGIWLAVTVGLIVLIALLRRKAKKAEAEPPADPEDDPDAEFIEEL